MTHEGRVTSTLAHLGDKAPPVRVLSPVPALPLGRQGHTLEQHVGRLWVVSGQGGKGYWDMALCIAAL